MSDIGTFQFYADNEWRTQIEGDLKLAVRQSPSARSLCLVLPRKAAMNRNRNTTGNHHPDLPIPVPPIPGWSHRPLAWLGWIAFYWLAINSVMIEMVLA